MTSDDKPAMLIDKLVSRIANTTVSFRSKETFGTIYSLNKRSAEILIFIAWWLYKLYHLFLYISNVMIMNIANIRFIQEIIFACPMWIKYAVWINIFCYEHF